MKSWAMRGFMVTLLLLTRAEVGFHRAGKTQHRRRDDEQHQRSDPHFSSSDPVEYRVYCCFCFSFDGHDLSFIPVTQKKRRKH